MSIFLAIFIKVLLILTLIEQLPALDTAKDVEGKDCTVVEPIRNHTFNLTELRTPLGYFIPPSDHRETFSFNVCGSLSRQCNNQTAAACMKDSSGKEVVLGYEEKLFWNDGSIRFSYMGEKCDATNNYTINVMLHCDYTETKKDFLGVFYEKGHCEVNIFLRTPKACLPVNDNLKNVKCVVKGSGGVYDFSSLRNSNHKAAGPNGTTFIIGICNPTLYGHETACEAGTSVCQYDPKAKSVESQYKNMGVMTQDFKQEKDYIGLTMTTNQPCEPTTNKTFSSSFMFECDPQAKVSYPTFHSTVNCVNIFSWTTSLACADKKPCQVSDPDTGVSFDFSSLSGIQYEAVNKNNTEENVFFSVCSQANEPCMKSSGSCVVKNSNKQSTQAGVMNADLKLKGKNPYLLYENGAICKKPGNTFTTRIDFVCADDVTDEIPVAVEDGCAITIYFATLLACDYIKNCIAKSVGDEEIDLRPLIDYDGNYEATVNETTLPNETGSVKYLLNVCRPLNAKYSLNCHGSSGACRTVIEKDGKHENELNLGHPHYSLSTLKKGDDTNEVTMKYFDGAECPTDKEEKIMTEIRFYCNQTAGHGNPILQTIDQCKYSFDFPTNILCNEQLVDMRNSSCLLLNEKISVDLKLFGENGVYKVDGYKDVSICGDEGTKFYTIVYKQSMVRIEFQLLNGKDKIDVEVQLKCSASNETNTKVDDRILVMHESPLICPLLKVKPRAKTADSKPITPGASDNDNSAKEENTSKGFALGYVFLVSIVVIAFVAFYLVVRNPERREIIRNIIKFRSRSSTVQYSRVRLNEESLLLDNNVAGLSESDDDDNILL